MPKVLYVSYDGLMEPLGQSQILSYLTRLAKDYDITLVSYEKSYEWSNLVNRSKFINIIKEAVTKIKEAAQDGIVALGNIFGFEMDRITSMLIHPCSWPNHSHSLSG